MQPAHVHHHPGHAARRAAAHAGRPAGHRALLGGQRGGRVPHAGCGLSADVRRHHVPVRLLVGRRRRHPRGRARPSTTRPTPPPSRPDRATTVFTDEFATDLGWVNNPLADRHGHHRPVAARRSRSRPAPAARSMQLGTGDGGTAQLPDHRPGRPDPRWAPTTSTAESPPSSSPAIALPASGTLTLSFAYYFAHLNNSSSADFFRVSVVNGSTATVVFQELGTAADDAGRLGHAVGQHQRRSPARPSASASRPPTPREAAWWRRAWTRC